MANLEQCYAIASNDVAGTLVDGEAIVLNLADGSCYSLEGASALAWELLHEGNTVGQVAAALTRMFVVNVITAETDLFRLTDQLLEEGLLVPTPHANAEVRTPGLAARPRMYRRLELHKYSDMVHPLDRAPRNSGAYQSS